MGGTLSEAATEIVAHKLCSRTCGIQVRQGDLCHKFAPRFCGTNCASRLVARRRPRGAKERETSSPIHGMRISIPRRSWFFWVSQPQSRQSNGRRPQSPPTPTDINAGSPRVNPVCLKVVMIVTPFRVFVLYNTCELWMVGCEGCHYSTYGMTACR